MATSPEKLLVVESDDVLRDSIARTLKQGGYEVSTDYSEGINSVLAFNPDAVILGADPPELDCCDLLSEMKGAERTQAIPVIMLSRGGPAERTRGLDLGADDVLSLPFEPHELLSRVRWQLRNKTAFDKLQQQARRAEENRNVAQQVVTAVNDERRALRVGRMIAIALLAVAGTVFLVFYHRTQQENVRVYAAITRLQSGMLTEQQLMDRSQRRLAEVQRDPAQAKDSQRLQLQKQSEDLRSQLAGRGSENVSALRSQLCAVEARLQRLESEGTVA